MRQAIRQVSGAFPRVRRPPVCVCVCAHTYGAVNITWSVSNLVPEFVDSLHGIQGPIMWGRRQDLQTWMESSRVNVHPEEDFPVPKWAFLIWRRSKSTAIDTLPNTRCLNAKFINLTGFLTFAFVYFPAWPNQDLLKSSPTSQNVPRTTHEPRK